MGKKKENGPKAAMALKKVPRNGKTDPNQGSFRQTKKEKGRFMNFSQGQI